MKVLIKRKGGEEKEKEDEERKMEEGREDKEEEIGRGDPPFQSELRPVLPALALTTPGRQLLSLSPFYRQGRLRQRTHSVKATQPADGGPGT